MLPEDKMPEAEVTLRLAMSLIEQGHTDDVVECAIDGAQIKTLNTVHFPIVEFLKSHGWTNTKSNELWQGEYNKIKLQFNYKCSL